MKSILILGAVALMASTSSAFATSATSGDPSEMWNNTRFNLKCEFSRDGDHSTEKNAECRADARIFFTSNDASEPGVLWQDLLTITCRDHLVYADEATLFRTNNGGERREFRLVGNVAPRPSIDLPFDTFRRHDHEALEENRKVRSELRLNFGEDRRALHGECTVERVVRE